MDETSSSIKVASLPSVDGLLGTDPSRLVAYLSFPYRIEARERQDSRTRGVQLDP